jgi:hypothetical protein
MPNYNPYMMQGNGAMPDMLNQMKVPYQQPQNITPAPMPKPANDMLWVLNENEATSYPVAPNNSVVLWDKSKATIYVKSVNAQGVPSIRILDFTERTEMPENAPKTHECKCGGKYATKEQFDALKGDFDELRAKYEELMDRQSVKPAKTVKKEAE